MIKKQLLDLMDNIMKIGVATMMKDTEIFMEALMSNLSWVDGIYLYDDNSSDKTIELAKKYAQAPLIIERGVSEKPVFSRGEMMVRNYVVDKAFEKLDCDVLILIDGDELISSSLKDLIIKKMSNDDYDSICFTTWHLYDEDKYLHFWETKINNVDLVDPHTRVIKKNKRFEKLFADGSHPIINPTKKTYCANGAFHFHLKYYKLSPYPNYALHFLPERITEKDLYHYIKKLPFKLPAEVKDALQKIDWTKHNKLDTDYYKYYKSERKLSASVEENLIHPKDKLL